MDHECGGCLYAGSGITALIYREKSGIAFLITILACLAIGVPLVSRKPSKKAFYSREGLVTTALSWIVLSIVGAVPFVLSGAIPNPIDAFFEIVSGFTTTGSSILSDPSQMPYSINIWRCFSHWIGGMGVLVFILTLLPLAGGYHMNLMKAESPGPSVGKLLPKVQSTAKVLYKIYIALTIALIIFLFMAGNAAISNCNAVFRLYIYYLVELLIRIISIATYCSMMRMKFSIGIPIS